MKTSLWLLAFGIFSAGLGVRAGDITGVISFKGAPPAEVELAAVMDNADCGPLNKSTPTTHYYVVGAKGGLADVVVSLKDVTGKSTGAGAAPAVIDQKGCVYFPTILAVQTGQKIIVKNSDPCVHNVHDVSKAGNPEHNDPQMPGGADLTYTFDKPEAFLKFQCDVHSWMFAWVTVVDSPYFSISDKDGKFTVKNVPPGKYTLQVAHRKLGIQTAEIEVKDSGATHDFTFEAK
jgi:plastocyanin